MRKVKLFIATSIDGYIAGENDDLSFLSLVEKDGEDYGYDKFVAEIDTIIIGRKTYEYVKEQLGISHYFNTAKNVYVITRNSTLKDESINFYSGKISDLITTLQSEPGKDIYCDGGSEVIHALLQEDLIDEMILSIVPIILGKGIRLFKSGLLESHWICKSSRYFETGLVQMHFIRKK